MIRRPSLHPRIILSIARKDALDIWLNKATLGGLLYPILMSLLYLLISHLVGGSTTPILVFNPGGSYVEQAVTAGFPNAAVTKASTAEEVAAAFGPDRAKVNTPYAIGLVVPADFDSALQAGSQPQVHLYLNDSTLQVQGRNLVTAAILNYARTVAQPQPPVTLVTALVNPSSDDAAVILTQVYVPITLLLSLIIGTTFVPQMLIEEKERKTLRMLMVTPASFEDILLGKLLVVLVYQIILTCVVLAIMSSFTGQIGLILLYVVLGACFSLALGLFFGSAFNSLSAATTVSGLVILLYVISGIFVGRMGEILGGSSPVVKLARILPTYYIADGVFNAAQGAGSAGSHLLNIGIILVSTVALLILSIWILRRQSAVTGSL